MESERPSLNALFDLANLSDLDSEVNSAVEAAMLTRCQQEAFRVYVAILVVTAAAAGLLTSLFVLLISLCNIHGDYRLFVANLALVDAICALLYAFMGYVNLSDRNTFSPSVMSYSAFAFYGSFGVLISALVPVSLSRIMAASKPRTYDSFFAGKRALAVCGLCDMLPVVLLCVICRTRHDVARWLFVMYATLTVLAHFVTFVSNFLVFWLVANHIKVVQCLHDRTRLLETRQVALATLAQAVVPLVCQVPAFLALSSTLLLVSPLTRHQDLIVLTQLWLAASPLLDSLITLFVIKQYRLQTAASLGVCCRPERCAHPALKHRPPGSNPTNNNNNNNVVHNNKSINNSSSNNNTMNNKSNCINNNNDKDCRIQSNYNNNNKDNNNNQSINNNNKEKDNVEEGNMLSSFSDNTAPRQCAA